MSATLIGGDEVNAIVLDIGTYQLKAGYAGEDAPKYIFPSAVGVGGESLSNGKSDMEVDNQKKLRAGTHALEVRRDGMEIIAPFTDGIMSDWDAVEALIDHAIEDQMRLNPEEHPLMLAEPSHNEKEAREKMTEILFEKYKFPAVFIAKNAVLSSFALGRQTSLVVDAGHEATVVSAVHDGYVLKKSVIRSPIGGHFLTKCMQQTIEDKGTTVHPRYSFKRVEMSPGNYTPEYFDVPNTTDSFKAYHVDAICQDAKQSVCRVSESPFDPAENTHIPTVTYELPDGQEIQIGSQRFTIPEMLFNPVLAKGFGEVGKEMMNTPGIETFGLADMVSQCINSCDVDARRELYSGVLLTGGTSLFQSIRERFEAELTAIAPSMMKVKVTASSNAIEKRYSTWIGGSILSSLGTFQQMWMSKFEYKEHGAGLIHKKAP